MIYNTYRRENFESIIGATDDKPKAPINEENEVIAPDIEEEKPKKVGKRKEK